MQTKISVRPFRIADMDQILAIEKASFGTDAYERNLFAELSNTCGKLFLVAVAGTNICGYMITCMRGARAPNAAELVSLAVHPESRGRGAALTLMRNTLRRLRLRGVVRFSLMVRVGNESARRFYKRNGFRKLRTVAGYYEDGEDGVLMSRAL